MKTSIEEKKKFNILLKNMGIDPNVYYNIDKDQEWDAMEASTSTGSGRASEKLKNFNRSTKSMGYEPLSVRKCVENTDYKKLLYQSAYEIDCMLFYFEDVFKVELSRGDAAKIVTKKFQDYYEGGNAYLKKFELVYPHMVDGVRKAKFFTKKQINTAKSVLENMDLDIPIEIEVVTYLQNNYASNQYAIAFRDIIQKLFPEFTEKILKEISNTALK